ncbi:hypothetical protein AYI68_g4386 [Smittium mucronatum]|uniref:Peptidase M16 C-terminal domain-containing protein n=1 Tax=Smittium mucronatum TaxID=133383 RepID=A0A1R0GX89_9FUNG|nr:hypothetical protein AYI68_g4386 [Smittium mucronatum]
MEKCWYYDSQNFSPESPSFGIETSSDGKVFPAISLIEKRSGLRIVVCKTPGPIGYLDALANNCISNGTNAYTAPDHTMYTIETAGEKGIFNTLPVFLDGIFNPILSENQFISEVYHFNQEGKESGVVFSEMSSVENTDLELLNNELVRNLYGKNYPYYYNYGGLTSEIATLSNQEIIQYHSCYYSPDRVTVLLVGAFDTNLNNLLSVFDSYSHFPVSNSNKNSIQSNTLSIPTFSQKLTISQVSFPSDSDEIGIIGFAWLGPSLTDLKTRLSLLILSQYLNETSSSPLNQKFVEKVDPMANYIDIEVRDYEPSCILMTFNGVPYTNQQSDDLDLFNENFFYTELISVLESLCSTVFNGVPNALHDTVNRYIIEYKLQIERNPIEEINNILLPTLLSHFYSPKPKGQAFSPINFQKSSKIFSILDDLLLESADYWIEIVKSWLINSECIMVKLVPDPKMGADISRRSLLRSSKLASAMSESEKSLLASKIENAINDNKINIPQGIISLMPKIPSTASIPILPYSQSTYNLNFEKSADINSNISINQDHQVASTPLFPFKIFSILESETSFIHLKLGFSMINLPDRLKPFLPLFSSLFFNTNMLIPANTPFDMDPETELEFPERLIDYKKVTSTLANVFVSHDISLANSSDYFSCYPPVELLTINAKLEPRKFNISIRWLIQSLLFISNSVSRILSVAKNLLSQLSESKRSGDFMINSIATKFSISDKTLLNESKPAKCPADLNFGSSIELAVNIFTQEKLLKKIISALETHIKLNPHLLGDSDSEDETESEDGSFSESENESISECLSDDDSPSVPDLIPNNSEDCEIDENVSKKHKGEHDKSENRSQRKYSGYTINSQILDNISAESIIKSLDEIRLHLLGYSDQNSTDVSGFAQIGIPSNFEISHEECIRKIVKNWDFFMIKQNHQMFGGPILNLPLSKYIQCTFEATPIKNFAEIKFSNSIGGHNGDLMTPFPFPINLQFPNKTLEKPKTNLHITSSNICSSYSIMIANCKELETIPYSQSDIISPAELEGISLRVLSGLLSRTDGLFYNVVRGNGYAYDCNVIFSPLRKNLYITCSDATDINMAFISIGKTIQDLLENDEFWVKSISDFEISLAKSNILYEEYSSISSPSSVLSNSTISNLRGFPNIDEMSKWTTRCIERVTRASLKNVLEKYFAKFIQKNVQTINIILTPPIEGRPRAPVNFEPNDFGWDFELADLEDLIE